MAEEPKTFMHVSDYVEKKSKHRNVLRQMCRFEDDEFENDHEELITLALRGKRALNKYNLSNELKSQLMDAVDFVLDKRLQLYTKSNEDFVRTQKNYQEWFASKTKKLMPIVVEKDYNRTGSSPQQSIQDLKKNVKGRIDLPISDEKINKVNTPEQEKVILDFRRIVRKLEAKKKKKQ